MKKRLPLIAVLTACVLVGLAAFFILGEERIGRPSRDSRASRSQPPPVLVGRAPETPATTANTANQSASGETVPVKPGLRVSVEITARKSREPVSNAIVFTSIDAQEAVAVDRSVKTDSEGKAVLEVPTAHVFLNVWANGFLPAQEALRNGVERISVVLEEGRTFRGTVVNQADEPLRGARISIYLPENALAALGDRFERSHYAGPRGAAGHATSDESGQFVVNGLPWHEPLQLVARLPGWLSTTPMEIAAEQEESRVQFVPMYGLRLVFKDAESGESLNYLDPRASWGLPANWYPLGLRSAMLGALLTDSPGIPDDQSVRHYFFRPLPHVRGNTARGEDARVDFEFSSVGYEVARGVVELEPGRIVEQTVLFQPVRGPRARVKFTAHFPDGKAYSGPLWALVGPSELGEAGTTLELRFEQGASSQEVLLPAGKHRITPRGPVSALGGDTLWWNPAGSSSIVDLTGSSATPTVDLQLTGQLIALTVTDTLGKRVRGYHLAIGRGPDNWHETPQWDVYQEFAAHALHASFGSPALWLPPGEWSIRARIERLGLGVGRVIVSSDGTTQELDLRLGGS